ncbi:MAG: LamG-like jellyroll fold domain-containing protein [Pseudomonadota bacterium]
MPREKIDPYFSLVALLIRPSKRPDGELVFRDLSKNKAVLSTFGDAKISTARTEFRDSTILMDGAGDYITAPNSSAYPPGAGDFTVETIQYSTDAGASQRCFMDVRANSTSGTGFFLREDSNGFIFGKASSAIVSTASGRIANKIQHIAVSRTASVFYMHVDGALKASVTDAQQFLDQNMLISGFCNNVASPFTFLGNIGQYRYTVGIGRYGSADFTPPSYFPLR